MPQKSLILYLPAVFCQLAKFRNDVSFLIFSADFKKKSYLCMQENEEEQHCSGLSLAAIRKKSRERKVRAAQGAPLLKMEAAGDSRGVAEENNRQTFLSPRSWERIGERQG